MHSSIRRRVATIRRLGRATVLATLPLAAASVHARAQASTPPTVVSLGTCRLESGATIPDCRVAYRTAGRLDAARSNAILVPTFFAGRSEDHAFMLGAYVDTARFHVVIVDALGDGHSSSPSNTAGAARDAFAGLTIGDMVETQRRLLVEHLGIRHVRAVVGISMGGFQAFEWAVRHPTFMDVAVPIVGTPRATPYDRLVYDAMRSAAEREDRSAADDSSWTRVSRLESIGMRTPAMLADSGSAWVERDVAALARAYRDGGWTFGDYAAQAGALRRHDVAARFDGSLSRAAAAVRARMLVVYSTDDRMVSPEPAAAFARLVGADTLDVRSACGHALFWCEAERVGRAVRGFLEQHATGVTAAAPPE